MSTDRGRWLALPLLVLTLVAFHPATATVGATPGTHVGHASWKSGRSVLPPTITGLVNLTPDGKASGGEPDRLTISGDGRYAAWADDSTTLVAGDTNGTSDVFVRDLITGTNELVSVSTTGAQGNAGIDFGPSISRDGRFVAFASRASNLVSGDSNGKLDVFVRDRKLHTTQRASVSSAEACESIIDREHRITLELLVSNFREKVGATPAGKAGA